MMARGFFAPLYQGIFEHRNKIGPALWEFALLITWITAEIPDPDLLGEKLGVVRGGKPIPIVDIANALHESFESAKRHLCRLERSGYIRRPKPAEGEAYCYLVRRSKKWGSNSAKQEIPEVKTDISTEEKGSVIAGRKVPGPSSISTLAERKSALTNNEENKASNPEQETNIFYSQCSDEIFQLFPAKDKFKHSATVPSDSRFAGCVKSIADYWSEFNPELDFQFDAKVGANLNGLLKRHKNLTIEQFDQCVRNRAKSEAINHALEPVCWIAALIKYAKGPLNKYGQPLKETVNETGRRQQQESFDAIDVAAAANRARRMAGTAHESGPGGLSSFKATHG